jgi:recombination protein RecA
MGKIDALNQITKALNSKNKRQNPDAEEPIVFLAAGNEALLDFGLLKTGNPAVDCALGGGFPRGNVVQITGPAGVGKSRLCLDMIAYNQQQDPHFIAMYVHLEARTGILRAALEAGVDLNRLLIVNAQASGEKTFDIMLRYLWDWETNRAVGAVDLVVIDSLAAAVPAQELGSAQKDGLEAMTVGAQARMLSKVFRIISGTGSLGRSILLTINQVRTDINSYGGGEVNPGGNAVKHYPKITINVRSRNSELLKRKVGAEEEVYGHKVRGTVVKNNAGYGNPHQTFHYDVVYGVGVDLVIPMVDAALKAGAILQTSGSWYQVPEWAADPTSPLKFNGRKALEEWVRANPDVYPWLEARIETLTTFQVAEEAPTTEIPDEVLEKAG